MILERSVKKLEEEKIILYDKKISEKEYLQWKVEKDRLQEELEELQQDNHLLDTNVLEGYLQREELTREMVECFIDCIYVYEDYIHINWNFVSASKQGVVKPSSTYDMITTTYLRHFFFTCFKLHSLGN